jgi:hypothetical protein
LLQQRAVSTLCVAKPTTREDCRVVVISKTEGFDFVFCASIAQHESHSVVVSGSCMLRVLQVRTIASFTSLLKSRQHSAWSLMTFTTSCAKLPLVREKDDTAANRRNELRSRRDRRDEIFCWGLSSAGS